MSHDHELASLVEPLLKDARTDVSGGARAVLSALAERAEAVHRLSKLLIASDRLEEAETLCAHLSFWTSEESELCVEIAKRWVVRGDTARALIAVSLAETAAVRIAENSLRADALAGVAWALSDTGQLVRANDTLERAIETARTGEASSDVQESDECMKALWAIAIQLAERGSEERARRVAESIAHHPHGRERALAQVERALGARKAP
jgi:hypothetical protein